MKSENKNKLSKLISASMGMAWHGMTFSIYNCTLQRWDWGKAAQLCIGMLYVLRETLLNMVILATFSCKMNGDEVAVGCDSATWNYVWDAPSDFWSASAVAWTWAAYCRFQSTSSNEGRVDGSGETHLLVIDTTIDNDSCEDVVSTIGSTIRFRPSWLPKDACNR